MSKQFSIFYILILVVIIIFQAHVYHLMKSDSYSRYLRSEMYKDFLNGSKKKVIALFLRSLIVNNSKFISLLCESYDQQELCS